MIFHKIFYLILFILLFNCAYKDFQISEPDTFCDYASGIDLKDTLLGMSLINITDMKDRVGNGQALRYKSEEGIQATIYFIHFKDVKTSNEISKKIISNYFNGTMEEIFRFQTLGIYKNLTIENTGNKKIIVKCDTLDAKYSKSIFECDSILNVSYTLVYGFESSVIKYRYTYPVEDSIKGEKLWNDFLSYFNMEFNRYNFLKDNEIGFDTVSDFLSLKHNLINSCNYLLSTQPDRYNLNFLISEYYVDTWYWQNPNKPIEVPELYYDILEENFVLSTVFLASLLREYFKKEANYNEEDKMHALHHFVKYCDNLKYLTDDYPVLFELRNQYNSNNWDNLVNKIRK